MICEAEKGAKLDQRGRAVKTTVPASDDERVEVTLKYDERDRLQHVVQRDGTQISLVYDESGQWQGFSFADGGKMILVRDESGAVVGIRRVDRSAGQRVSLVKGASLLRASFSPARVTDVCRNAVAAAAATAAAICAAGPSLPCATALAAAAVAAKIAYDACTGSDGAPAESGPVG